MRIIGVDPGTTESGIAHLVDGKVEASGVVDNYDLMAQLTCYGTDGPAVLAIEMIASYGMAVGADVFKTCVWVGRIQQSWIAPDDVRLVYRRDAKLHLCNSPRAKDANVRQALIDRYGPPGTKKAPGGTYGVKSHAWQALAVATYAHDVLTGSAK